jgi:CheY-like chemotaxis protein
MAESKNIGRRILVVDDEEMVCKTLKMVLSLDQHAVTTATSGQEGLSLFEPGRFDLVITDYRMPDLNGDKLAAAIRAQAPQQKILMITAYGQSLLTGDFPLAVDEVMAKPFDLQEFRDAVRQLTATNGAPEVHLRPGDSLVARS